MCLLQVGRTRRAPEGLWLDGFAWQKHPGHPCRLLLDLPEWKPVRRATVCSGAIAMARLFTPSRAASCKGSNRMQCRHLSAYGSTMHKAL